MTIENKIIAAAVLGTIAFNDGQTRIPCHDSKLMNLLTGLPVGGGSSEIMGAWINSWDNANFCK